MIFILMGQKVIDDDLIFTRNIKIAVCRSRRSLIVCSVWQRAAATEKTTTTTTTAEKSQQKIAPFECIQLFCLWALFKYDIINIIKSIRCCDLRLCQTLWNVCVLIRNHHVTSLMKMILCSAIDREEFSETSSSWPSGNSRLCWKWNKHNKKYFSRSTKEEE